MSQIINDIQKYTVLPLSIINRGDKLMDDIIVSTPHKGLVVIEAKDIHHPFLFGSTTQTDKSVDSIFREIHELERESVDYLINKWKETIIK